MIEKSPTDLLDSERQATAELKNQKLENCSQAASQSDVAIAYAIRRKSVARRRTFRPSQGDQRNATA